jgi:PAS domain S-box-containing protein
MPLRSESQTSVLGEALDPGPVAILVGDEHMRFAAVNEYAAQLLGYSRAELLELSVTDITSESDLPDRFSSLVRTGSAGGATKLRRRDGRTIPVRFAAKETRAAGLPFFVLVAFA